MNYQPRTYRKQFNRERFHTFTIQHLESDILFGIDHAAYNEAIGGGLKKRCLQRIKDTRNTVDSYGARHPGFIESHEPLSLDPAAPSIVKEMMACGIKSATGPMAAVAGLFARETAHELKQSLALSELIVENGGDIFLINKDRLLMTVYAGSSPLSNKLAIEIPAGEWGISTSSGTIGHSFSYGKADAATIICKDPLLSDAWATSIANRVQGEDDIESVLAFTETIPEILFCMIICGERLGVRGEFTIKPVSH